MRGQKAQLIAELSVSGGARTRSEFRRQKVLQMMAEDDQPRTYYFWPDTESSRDYVVIACAKRGVATWDMTIEREKWDAMKFLDLVEKMQ